MSENCPCQSGKSYEQCCGRFITHQAQPENARELMRSRFSAYVRNDTDYLMQSWHRDFRPDQLTLDLDIRWLGLELIAFSEDDDEASVEFEATLAADGRIDALREKSRFVRENGQWLYTDGDMLEPRRKPLKIGRNEPCPCASGLKFKRCCGKG